jgi:hypothetical protein
MFESKDEFIQWDGTRNGVDADTGVYIWRLSFEGYTEGGGTYSEVQTGNVTLVR